MQVGITMRNSLDEWGTFVTALLMTLRLEQRLGAVFPEDKVSEVKTLRDVAVLIASISGSTCEPSACMELTTWAVGELEKEPLWSRRGSSSRQVDDIRTLDFDAPILDVLDPGRWKSS